MVQDVDAVISDAASSADADVLLDGVSVASRIAACNAVWLERQRDQAWGALWDALAALDAPRFRTAISASDSLMGLNAGCGSCDCVAWCAACPPVSHVQNVNLGFTCYTCAA